MKFKDVEVGGCFYFRDPQMQEHKYTFFIKHPATFSEWADKNCVPSGWGWMCVGNYEDVRFADDYEVTIISALWYQDACLRIYEERMRTDNPKGEMHPYDIKLAKAGWSAELRSKIMESQEKDRNQVLVDYNDDDLI